MSRSWRVCYAGDPAPPGDTDITYSWEFTSADGPFALLRVDELADSAGATQNAYDVISTLDPADELGSAWFIVRAHTAFGDPALEAQFNSWYDDVHVPEFCASDGILRNWRLRCRERPRDYWAVYEIRSAGHFERAVKERADAGKQPFDGIWLPYLTYAGSTHQIVHREGGTIAP